MKRSDKMIKRAFLGSLCFFFVATPIVSQVDAASLEKEKVIITFKGDIDYTTLKEYNIDIKEEFKNIPSVTAEVPKYVSRTLSSDSSILSIEKDVLVTLNQDEEIDYGTQMVEAPKAWNSNYTGKNIKVGVIDTGADTDHLDLTIKGGVSFVEEYDGYKGYKDYHGHGTHVAGIIGAKHNDTGIDGVAPDTQIYAIKAFDSSGTAYASTVIEALDWAINQKMDIINMSIGFQEAVPALENMLKTAESKGILLVAASGNDGVTDKTKDNVDFPARYSSVIAVSAVDSNKKRANFNANGELGVGVDAWSSTGNTVDVAAPGYNIVSTYPNNQFAYMSGTSMAAPFVTGLLALLKEAYPNASAKELRQILIDNAIDIGTTGKDVEFGYGLAHFSKDTENLLEVSSLKENHSDTSVTLSWTNPGQDFKEVKIYKNGLFLAKTTAKTYTDKNLASNTSFSYKLTTVDTSGNESNGVSINAKTDEAYPVPKQVEDVRSTITEDSIKLEWTLPTDPNFKEVKIYQNGQLFFTTSTMNNIEKGNLTPATDYEYRFVSVSHKGKESAPVIVKLRTKNSSKPAVVTGVKASLDYDKNQVVVSWNKAKETNITGYYVYINGVKYDELPASVTSHKIAFSQLDQTKALTFSVRSINDLNKLSDESAGATINLRHKVRFTDVKDTHWAYDSIRYVSDREWMSGSDSLTTFKPSKTLTRAEAATIFVRVLKLEPKKTISASFKDVSTKHWAYREIEIAKQHNIFSGTDNKSFSPEKTISRREMAAVLNRILNDSNAPKKVTSSRFKDVKSNDWAHNDILAMTEQNMLVGYEDGTFQPSKSLTRDEMAALVVRIVPYLK